MVIPHLEYPPVPLNTASTTNQFKFQAVQNKALRWVNGDRPPYTFTIIQLHEKYKMELLNVRNFRASYKLWETLREHHEDEHSKILD